MSRTIDQRVVEMQFDNSNFEKNVDKSLSTLDKLKAALHLGNSVDEFDEVETATQRLGKSIGVFEEIATGALRRFGSSVEEWAARTIRAMSGVDNVFEGFSKFGRMTESTGTLVAQGFALKDVETQVNRLRWFSDETSYSLTDMTENISKFTATGKDLEESSDAMMGIALWAALSGKNAGEASRAMYQLSQAMSAGKMRLEDYKSIQNLSMDTREFRQIALDTGVALGTLKKNANGLYHTINPDSGYNDWFSIDKFTETLTTGGWMTDEVQMATYRKYGSAINDIYNYVQENGVTASEAIEQLGGSIDAFGLKAFKAGGEARTWAQTIDSVKDALSSGWAQIFQYIFGNYDQAVAFYTDLSEKFYDLFVEPVNGLVKAFSVWGVLGGRNSFISGITDGIDVIQDLTSKVGDQFNEVFFMDNKKTAIAVYEKDIKSYERRLKEAAKTAEALGKEAGPAFSDEEIVAANRGRAMLDITSKFRKFIDALVEANEKTDGLMRAVKGLFSIFKIVKSAVSSAVKAITPLFSGAGKVLEWFFDKLGDLGDWFVKLSQKLEKNNSLGRFFTSFFKPLFNLKNDLISFKNIFLPQFTERWNEFKKSFAGKFAKSSGAQQLRSILDDIKTKWENLFTNFDAEKAVNGLFSAWEKLKELLRSMFGIEEGKFADWVIEKFNSISSEMSELWKNTKKYLGGAWESAKGYFSDAKEWLSDNWDSIPSSVKSVWGAISGVFTYFWNGLKDVFGGDAFESILGILKNVASFIGKTIGVIIKMLQPLLDAIKNAIGSMDMSNIAEWIRSGGILALGIALNNFADWLIYSGPLGAISRVLDSVADVMNSFAHTLDAKALKDAAVGIAILVGSLFVLVGMNPEDMIAAAIAMETIVAILARSLRQLSGFTKNANLGKGGLSITKSSASSVIIAAAVSLVLIAWALRIIAKIPTDELYTAATVAGIMMAVIGLIIKSILKTEKIGSKSNAFNGKFKGKFKTSIGSGNTFFNAGPGATIFAAAVFFVAVWFVLKQMTDIVKDTNIVTLLVSIGAVAGILAALVAITKIINKIETKKGNWLNVIAVAAAVAIVAMSFGKIVDAISSATKHGAAGSAIMAMTVILGGLTLFMHTIGKAQIKEPVKLVAMLVSMVTAIYVLGEVIGALATSFNGVSNNAIDQSINTFIIALTGLILAIGVMALLSKSKSIDMKKVLPLAFGMVLVSYAVSDLLDGIKGFTSTDVDAVWALVGVIGAMVASVAVLALISKSEKIDAKKVSDLTNSMTAIAFSILIISFAMRGFTNADSDAVWRMVGVMAGLVAAVAILSSLSKSDKIDAAKIIKMSEAMVVISAALWIASEAATNFVGIDSVALKKAGIALAALVAAVALLGVLGATKIGDGFNKFAEGLLKISGGVALIGASFLLAAEAIKRFGSEQINIKQAAENIGGFIDEILMKLPEWTVKIFAVLFETAYALIPAKIMALIDAVIKTCDMLLEDNRLVKLIEKLCTVAGIVLDGLIENAPELVEKVGGLLLALLNSLASWVTSNETAISTALRETVEAICGVVLGLFDSIGEKVFGDMWKPIKESLKEIAGPTVLGLLLIKFTGFGSAAAIALDPLTSKLLLILGLVSGVVALFGKDSPLRALDADVNPTGNDLYGYYLKKAYEKPMPENEYNEDAWWARQEAWARSMAKEGLAKGYSVDANGNLVVKGNVNGKMITGKGSIGTSAEGFVKVANALTGAAIDMKNAATNVAAVAATADSYPKVVDSGTTITSNVTYNVTGDLSPTDTYRMQQSAFGKLVDKISK